VTKRHWTVACAISFLLCGTPAVNAESAAGTGPGPVTRTDADQVLLVNAVRSVQVEKASDGKWVATVDYFYTGKPMAGRIVVKQWVTKTTSNVDAVPERAAETAAQMGANRVRLTLKPPSDDRYTQKLDAELVDPGERVMAGAEVVRLLEWPDPVVARAAGAIDGMTADAVLAQVGGLIDSQRADLLPDAFTLLQALLQRDPGEARAFLDLARIAMKTNWSAEGLAQAEALIGKALELRPGSADAQILLGYVYANQGRTKQAQSMFETASRSGTKNLWLWTNWGELLLAQGQEGRAIERFRQAIQSPRGEAANDRARMQAYAQLISIYGRRGDDDSLDALYRRRHSDYPDSTCAGLAYARFLEARRGDKAAAVAIRKTLRGDRCEA
jgi:hypothetical protein